VKRRSVLFLATGSPGNIRPMLAAARACAQAGLRVHCATNRLWERWVISHGVQWRLLSPLVEAYITHGATYPDLAEAFSSQSGAQALLLRVRDVWRNDDAKRELHALFHDVALIVACSALPRIRTAADALNIPYIGISRYGRQAFRSENRQGALLYASSSVLLDPDVVQSPLERITGEWVLPTEQAIPAPLRRFVQVNQPYIIVTHGAFLSSSAQSVVQQSVAAARSLGLRVIALQPSDATTLQSDAETLVWHHGLSHQKIFAGAACVIHPGGAGTTHRVARAGVPSLPIPLQRSDAYWAMRALQVQLTGYVLRADSLTQRTLSDAIAHMTTDVTYRFRSRNFAMQMANEQGLQQMLSIVEPYVGAA